MALLPFFVKSFAPKSCQTYSHRSKIQDRRRSEFLSQISFAPIPHHLSSLLKGKPIVRASELRRRNKTLKTCLLCLIIQVMRSSFLCTSTLWMLLLTASPPSIRAQSNPICYICGLGQEVKAPEGIIAIPNQGSRTCGDVQSLGLEGRILPMQCDELLRDDHAQVPCSCSSFQCPICGNGGSIGSPTGRFSLSNGSTITCAAAEDAAMAGTYDQNACPLIQSSAEAVCGCQPAVPAAPTVAGFPTRPPVGGFPTLSPGPPTPRPTRDPLVPTNPPPSDTITPRDPNSGASMTCISFAPFLVSALLMARVLI